MALFTKDDLSSMMGGSSNNNSVFSERELRDMMGEPPDKDDGYLSNIKKGVVSGVAGTYGGIADLLHFDTAGNYLNGIVKDNRRRKEFDTVFSLDYLSDPAGATYDISNQVGSMVALAPAALLAPEAAVTGVAAGGARVLAGIGGKKAAQWAASKAGQSALRMGARGTFTAVPESMSEGGNTRRQAIEEGLDNPDLRAWKVTGENMLTLPVSNAVEYMTLTGKLFRPSAKAGESIAKRALKAPARMAPAVGANSLQQGTEELLQQTYQDSALDREVGNVLNPFNWTDSQRMAFETGWAGGLALGSVSGGYRAMRSRPEEGNNTDSRTDPAPESSPSSNIESMLAAAAQKYGVDPDLVHAVAFTESSLRPDAVSEAGAQGVMQLMPETAASLGVSDPFDPAQNIDAGVRYLKQLQDMFGGDANKALAAYNTGMGTVQENGITGDGQKYIDQVMGNYKKGSMNQESDYDIPDQKYYTVLGEVSNPDLTDLTETKLNLLARDFQNKYGSPLKITSMKRNGDGSSWHDSGQAIDMVSDILEKDPGARAWLMEQGKRYGLVGLDEYANPSANATGGHIHFSDHGEALKGQAKASGSASLREEYRDENEYYSDLIGTKIEDAVNSNNIEEWNFLEEAKASGNKEQVIEKYPDIKEKLEQYRQGAAEEAAGKSNASRNAAIRHIKKRGYIDLPAGKAEMFRQDPISKGFAESKAGDMIRFTAPENFIERPGVKDVINRTAPNGTQKQNENMINRAIAYYDRTTDPAEKALIEKLVDSNNIEGLKLAFPFLSGDNVSIPEFAEPGNQAFVDPAIRGLLSRLATAVNAGAVNKFDQAPRIYREQKQNAVGNLASALRSMAGRKSIESAQEIQYERQKRKDEERANYNGFMPEEFYTNREGLQQSQTGLDRQRQARENEYAQMFDGLVRADIESFKSSLNKEEEQFLDFIDNEFSDADQAVRDILSALKKEREAQINHYVNVLKSQPKDTKRKIKKANLESYLRDVAIENLTQTDREFNIREDAIRGIEGIQAKAKQYGELQSRIPRENLEGHGNGKTDIREGTLDRAKSYGKQLLDAADGSARRRLNDPSTSRGLNELGLVDAQGRMQGPTKSGIHVTAEDKVLEKAYQSAVNRGEYKKAAEIARRMGNTQIAELLSPQSENKSYGERLLDLVNTHNIPANRKLMTELGQNDSVAIRTAERRLKSAGVSMPAPIVEQSQEYAQHILNAAKEKGIKADYRKLEHDIKRGEPKATEYIEKQLTKSGASLNEIKYSFSSRHERDRERMRKLDKDVKYYVPEDYQGKSVGVSEGLANHEEQSIKEDVERWLKAGKNLEFIEKHYQLAYNRYKANKSDGISSEKKRAFMSFLEWAMSYVRNKRGNVSGIPGANGSVYNVGNGRREEGSVSANNRGTHGRNNGPGINGNEINETSHSEKSGFSTPENTKYSFTDDAITAKIKESTGINIQLVPERFVSPSLKRIMRLGEQMGCPVQYFNGPSNMHGFHAGGKTFLNRRSSRSIQETFWHETFHWLRNNNGRLYSDLVAEIQKHSPFTESQIDAYRKTIHLGELRAEDGKYLKSDGDIIEEMLADKMPTVAGRLGLSKLLAKENPSLYERFVGFIDNLLQKLKDLAANSTELNQARVMEQAFYKMANDMRNAEGKQIFRANPHTKKLVLMRTGRAIGMEKLEPEAAVAYSQEKTETPTEKRARELRKLGYKKNDALDVLVDEYRDEKYDSEDYLPGYAQHKELTTKAVGKMISDIKKYVDRGIPFEIIEKQLYQRYNQEKGKINEGLTIDDVTAKAAHIKGAIWHARRYFKEDVRRTLGNAEPRTTGELWRTPDGRTDRRVDGGLLQGAPGKEINAKDDVGRFLMGSEAWRKEQRRQEKSENILRPPEKTAFSMPKNDDILYSFSDNNRGSLIGKIRNIFSGGRHVHPVTRQHIVRSLEELGRIKIAFGKLEGDEAVVYKEIENVIRAKRAYDWENLLPKVGKAIARQLGISDKEPMQNYIADWFLTGATNNTSTESVEFARAMRENPQFAERMMETQEMFQHWNSMEAMERGKGIISWSKPKDDASSLLTRTLRGLHDQFIEELGPVKRLVKDIEKRTGKTLSAAGNPYTAFRLFRGHFGKSMVAIEGTQLSVKALKNVFPSINFDNFKTLHTILTEAGVLRNKEKMQEFITYAVAKHVKDIHIHNKTAEETMDTPFTEKDCDEIIAAASPKYAQAQKDLVHYFNTLAAILADSGVISRKRYHEMKNGWKNYVPLFRVFEENEEISFGDSTKHMSGSSRDIVNPLESIIKNTYAFIKSAEKNKAKAKLGMVAKMSGVGEYIESVDNARPDDKTTITYLVDGKRMYLKTDPEIVKVINTLGVESSNWFMKAFRLPTQIARATVTILNPEFAIRNMFADVGDATLYSKYGFTPADFFRGFMHALRKDELYYEFIASGAGQSSAISLDRNYAQATIDNMSKTTREKYLSTSMFRSVLNALQAFGEYSEYGTRIGAYEKARKAEQKKAAAEGRRTDTAGIAEAALESRDLMDFARGGKASRSWNQISMFSNASLQGWDKFFRTFDFSDPHQAKHAKSALLRLFFTAALPALAMWMINRDDDRYKEIPEWQKNKHWIIFLGDKIFRIPKGHDVGIQLFSNWIEKGLNAAYAKDPLTLKKALRPIADMLPSLMPTAVLPITEAMANYSFFTERPIVPRYQEKLPDKMQYDSNTTSLAKFVGEQTGLSPKKIEHVLFGYTGGLGKAIPNTYDYATGKKQLNTAIEELPFARGIMIMPYKNAKSVTDYYEAVNEQTKYYNELKATGKRPEEFNPSLYGRIKAATPTMQKLSKMERAIADNADMPVEMKKQKQVEIQRRRIEIAKKVMVR